MATTGTNSRTSSFIVENNTSNESSKIIIPNNWWHSDVSINFTKETEYSLSEKESDYSPKYTHTPKVYELPKSRHWSIYDGDYNRKGSDENGDYGTGKSLSKDTKRMIRNISVIAGLALTFLITFLILTSSFFADNPAITQ